jgi:NAD(P)H-nitrite reductase large subunit
VAGINMAGNVHKLAGELAYNMLPVFDCTAAFMERRDDGDERTEVLMHTVRRKSIYRKILVQNNRIVGAVMLGSYQDAGVLLYLLRKRKNIAAFKDSLARGQVSWGQVAKRNGINPSKGGDANVG